MSNASSSPTPSEHSSTETKKVNTLPPALNLLIANSQTQPQQTGDALHDAHLLLTMAKTLNTDSPWFGKAQIKHHFLNSPTKDFTSAWNGAVVANPEAGLAKL